MGCVFKNVLPKTKENRSCMAKKKKKLDDVCFPVPKDISLAVTQKIDDNITLKNHLFQQTIQTAYQISIPYSFTASYEPEKPYQLTTDEQTETVAKLFQAIQPQDAVEMALAQQFIVVHLQAMNSAKSGISEKDIKKFELTHQILETLTKYRAKGAQQISVQYNVNQGQVVNIKGGRGSEEEPLTLKGEVR